MAKISKKQQAKMQRARKAALAKRKRTAKKYARILKNVPEAYPRSFFNAALPPPVRGAALMRGGVYASRVPGTVYDADSDGWIAREEAGSGYPADDGGYDYDEPSVWEQQVPSLVASQQRQIPRKCNSVIASAASIKTGLRDNTIACKTPRIAKRVDHAYEQALVGKCDLAARMLMRAMKGCKRRTTPMRPLRNANW